MTRGLSQCVPIAPGTTHVLSAQLRGLEGTPGRVDLQVDLYGAKGCTGRVVGSVSPVGTGRTDGEFVGRFGRFDTPNSASSALVRILATDAGAGAPFQATVDDVVLRPDNPSPVLP